MSNCFIDFDLLRAERNNKLLYLVSSYDQSVYHGVEFVPHHKDLEELYQLDEGLCRLLN